MCVSLHLSYVPYCTHHVSVIVSIIMSIVLLLLVNYHVCVGMVSWSALVWHCICISASSECVIGPPLHLSLVHCYICMSLLSGPHWSAVVSTITSIITFTVCPSSRHAHHAPTMVSIIASIMAIFMVCHCVHHGSVTATTIDPPLSCPSASLGELQWTT
jgi:hypothetical protein